MNDDQKNSEMNTWIDPELEARVVAWVAGEASPFEIAELERLVAEKPELAIFKRRIEAVHGLVARAAKPDAEPLRMSEERRAKLLATLGVAAKPDPAVVPLPAPKRPRRRLPRWMFAAAACLTVAGLTSVVIFTPARKPVRPDPAQTVMGPAASPNSRPETIGNTQGVVNEQVVLSPFEVRKSKSEQLLDRAKGLFRRDERASPDNLAKAEQPEASRRAIEAARAAALREDEAQRAAANAKRESNMRVTFPPAESGSLGFSGGGGGRGGRGTSVAPASAAPIPQSPAPPADLAFITAPKPNLSGDELSLRSPAGVGGVNAPADHYFFDAKIGAMTLANENAKQAIAGGVMGGSAGTLVPSGSSSWQVPSGSTLQMTNGVTFGAASATALGVAGPAKEDAAALSPFTVSTAPDRGYVATDTLAGTRLRSELKDLAASVTIVPKSEAGQKFMNEIGAADSSPRLSGAGTLTVTGGNAYAGASVVNGGTLAFGTGGTMNATNGTSGKIGLTGMGSPSPVTVVAADYFGPVVSPVDGVAAIKGNLNGNLKRIDLAAGEEKPLAEGPVKLDAVKAGVAPELPTAATGEVISQGFRLSASEPEKNAPAEEKKVRDLSQFHGVGQEKAKTNADADDAKRPAPAATTPPPSPPPSEETSTAKEPVSTFSLHVSDVSFRLVQGALARNEAIDPERIRPEEFYNAFDYGDPSPTPAEKVSCHIEQAAHPFLQQRNLVRIALKVAASGRVASQALRLTVLLDTSGSMEREDRAAASKRALEALASLLGPDDRLTLIGFARTPRLIAEAVPGDQVRTALDAMVRTPAEGGTNLEEALKLGAEMAQRHRLPGARNRIVLVTDGAANLGNADPARLAASIELLRQDGIAFDACGVGRDGIDDAMLEPLTRKGDGRYYVIDSPEAADAGFARQLAGAFRPAAENVKVQVRFNPGRVASYRLLGFEKHRLNEADFRNDAVDAAELAAEENAVALYQVEPLPQGDGELGDVSVRFRDPATGTMVERTWTLNYDARTPAFDRATPSMQLAGLAALFTEKLRETPLAQQFKLEDFVGVMNQVRAHYAGQPRVQEFAQMFERGRREE